MTRKKEEEEDREPAVHAERLRVSDREVAACEQLELQHRLCGMALAPEEGRERDDASCERNDDRGAAPAVPRLLDQREHEAGQPDGAQPGAGRVDSAAAQPLGSRYRGEDQRQGGEDERHVEREDPAPGDLVDDPAARERPDDRRDPTPSGPGTDRGAALLRREGGDDDRQRARSDERAGRALQRASGDQHVDRRGSRTQQGEQAERGDARREDATLAVDVAERAADQDQRPQREQIGVRHPLLRREAAAEVALDRGQGDVDDRAVDRGHRRSEDRGEQRQPLSPRHGSRGATTNATSST